MNTQPQTPEVQAAPPAGATAGATAANPGSREEEMIKGLVDDLFDTGRAFASIGLSVAEVAVGNTGKSLQLLGQTLGKLRSTLVEPKSGEASATERNAA